MTSDIPVVGINSNADATCRGCSGGGIDRRNMFGDRTTVLGIRLTDYQREKLKALAERDGIKEVDYVRNLINKAIEGDYENLT